MNKKMVLRVIGVISLFVALFLGIFAKEPFIDFVINGNHLALSGSFSFLFLLVGIVSLSYSIFMKRR